MLKEKIKNSKGIAGADTLIAILIFALFTGIIATLSYNINLLSVYVKRSVQANNYIINFYEYVDKINVEDTIEGDLVDYMNQKNDERISAKAYNDTQELITPYKMKIRVQDYVPELVDDVYGNILVKIVSISLSYRVGDEEKVIEIQRMKSRDINNEGIGG